MSACPMIYWSALGFIPPIAILVQKVCLIVWAVTDFGISTPPVAAYRFRIVLLIATVAAIRGIHDALKQLYRRSRLLEAVAHNRMQEGVPATAGRLLSAVGNDRYLAAFGAPSGQNLLLHFQTFLIVAYVSR